MYKFGLFQISVSLWGWSNRENFLPLKKSFAWQHKMTACCETVIQLVYHIVLWGPGGTKLWNPNLMFLKVSQAILCWETNILAHGENSPFCQVSLWKWNLNKCMNNKAHLFVIMFFCIILCAKCKKNYSCSNQNFDSFKK